ncbi:MAG TPA: T9SS type A sorting domain-containing protein [Prolixibacteraceae bacterium]|nr:T9SS type A sorting domain-containing protein [Prolixibacteraceae bacterium]
MKRFYLFILILTTCLAAKAQTPQLAWQKIFSSKSAATDSTSLIKINAVENTVYIAGTSDAWGKGNDIVLIKRNIATGDTIWTRHYNGPANGDDQVADFVINQATGDVYVTGKSMGNGTAYDVVTLKYLANGDLSWAKRWDNPDNHGDDVPISIGIDSKSILYLGGTTYNGQYKFEDVLALKYDSNGNVFASTTNLDDSNYNNNSHDQVGAMKVNNSGDLYTAGEFIVGEKTNGYSVVYSFSQTFQNCGIGFYCGNLWNYSYQCIGSYSKPYSGFPKSTTIYSPDDFNYFNAMDMDNSNNVYLAYLNDTIAKSGQGYTARIAKVNSTGCQVWEKKYGKSANARDLGIKSVKVDLSGNVYVAGFEKNTSGNLDWIVIKYNSSGTFQWKATKKGTANGNDIPFDIAFDSYQNPYISGVTTNTGTNKDITVVKYNKSNGAEVFTLNYDSNNKDESAYNVVVDGSQNIFVNGISNSGSQTSKMISLKYCNPPATAGTITGITNICQGQNLVNYSVPEIENATSYVWTLPTGVTGTSTTNSISVSFGTNATSGSITVKGRNSCSDGASSTLAIVVNPLPSGASVITGNSTVCQGTQSITYSIPVISNASSYIWTLPSGATGTSTSNSISVSFGINAVSGNITVKGHNDCGDGTESSLAITVNGVVAQAEAITGPKTVCGTQNNVIYSVPTIANATSYVWTLPTGATGTSTSNSITVNFGASAVSGGVEVYGKNSCGNGLASVLAVNVGTLPDNAGAISGNTMVCQGQSPIEYSVPVITGSTSYLWTLPLGATGTSTTNKITVLFGNMAVSGEITVKGTNSCGEGTQSKLPITVNPIPSAAGTISGNSTICQGEQSVLYVVPTIANTTSYVWTLPSGATGTSTTKSIIVNFGVNAGSGNITVKGHNDCGDGTASSFAVNVNQKPIIPTITINGNALNSSASTGNQWYNQTGAINGATAQEYTPKSGGDYYVIVTSNNCNSDISNTMHFIPTGIIPSKLASALKVYPNPVTNELIIELPGNTNPINFEIVSSSGQSVYNGIIGNKVTIQTSNLASGVYLLKLESGKSFEFKKIIKK